MRTVSCFRAFEGNCALLAIITAVVALPLGAAASPAPADTPTDASESAGAVEAHIKLFPTAEFHKVSPYIYGQFIEHIGGCIYDGIWVPEGSEIENSGGIRLDTVRALRKLEVPVVRWPGGLFADNYHWRDGIGPSDKRPVRQNLGWNTTESNQFGTHEFMRFCKLIGTEPYLCVNVGSGTVEEARAWAEYCNSDKDTMLTRQRAANGHPQPFGVKFWSLGNEPEYALDGMMLPDHYLDVARTYAGYVKHFACQSVWRGDGKLKEAKIVLGELGDTKIFKDQVRKVKNIYFDLLSLHLYANTSHAPDIPPADTHYQLISRLPRLEQRIKRLCDVAQELSTSDHSVGVAVDEWGIWRHGEADSLNGLVQKAPIGDALFAAAFFHVLHRYEKVYMANIAQSINVLHALILTRGKKFCVTPTYHVFEMFRPHRNAKVIDFSVECGKKLPPSDAAGRNALSVSVTKSQDGGELFISAVNLDLRDDIIAKIEVADGNKWKVQEVRRLVAEDIDCGNIFDDPNRVRPEAVDTDRLSADGKFRLKARSVTTIRMKK
ncbi:MAG TPA: alpha-L-arabinofuranosidase C-terminal domain-containing protein [Sedimentisphaerales bacterium]|nr:alpha-L-arabinofuranosidase C-terminal domain-containing protein [Sedimentisphaerales bacterium]